MPSERNRLDRLAQHVQWKSSKEQGIHHKDVSKRRPSPLILADKPIEHPQRLSVSNRSSHRGGYEQQDLASIYEGPSPPQASEDVFLRHVDLSPQPHPQDTVIAELLAENLDFYNGYKYFASIGNSLSECDRSLLPDPLFFDYEDRRVVLPRRSSAVDGSQHRLNESPPIQQKVHSTTLTPMHGLSGDGDHYYGAYAAPLPTSGGKLKPLPRRSLSSPSKPGQSDVSKIERSWFIQDDLESSGLPLMSSPDPSRSIIDQIRSSLRPVKLINQLSPAKKLPRSPRALLFASSPFSDDDDDHHQTNTNSRTQKARGYPLDNRYPLLQSGDSGARDEPIGSEIAAFNDPFIVDPHTVGSLTPRGAPWNRPFRPFPRELTKVMLADMAKEGWLEVGDTWIYFRLVRTMKDDIYLNKELKLCKIHQDGTLTIAIPKGPLRKIPETQQQIDRKPIPPPHGYGSPFPDSPTLPFNSSNATLLRHSIRAQHQQKTPCEVETDTFIKQPATPRSTTTSGGTTLTITSDDSVLTPRKRPTAFDVARSASVRTTPTYGPRPQPPKRPVYSSPSSNEAVVADIKLLQDLEGRIFELDGRISGGRRYEFGSNIWKQIRCLRGNRDLGTLWDMRQECAREWKKTGER